MKTDAQIHHDVIEELKWDTRVEETDVGVEVDAGVVTLTGTVHSFAAKLAAQEAAHRVAGVLDVANDIEVRLPGSGTPSDTDIAQAVRHALVWDVLVPEERIHTTVAHGWVTLEGAVEVWSHREDAERAVRHLAGVLGATNDVRVVSPAVEPAVIREAIEAALTGRARREAERMVVEVEDGRVALRGRVRSWEEKRAVLGAAAHASGIQAIDDHLRIEPLP